MEATPLTAARRHRPLGAAPWSFPQARTTKAKSATAATRIAATQAPCRQLAPRQGARRCKGCVWPDGTDSREA